MSLETHYRQVLDLSQRMLTAGMAQHWDELISLEQQRRARLDTAPPATPTNASPALLELIRQIQQCDAELSEKIEAWMTHARILLRLDPQASPKP